MGIERMSFEHVLFGVRDLLKRFPDHIEKALPSAIDDPPFSESDTGRFGIIIVQQKDDERKSFSVRTNFINEQSQKIVESSFIYLVPILRVEDPESPAANSKGCYTVSCIGWKIHQGKQGTEHNREALIALLKKIPTILS